MSRRNEINKEPVGCRLRPYEYRRLLLGEGPKLLWRYRCEYVFNTLFVGLLKLTLIPTDKERFPSGMNNLTDQIHALGL